MDRNTNVMMNDSFFILIELITYFYFGQANIRKKAFDKPITPLNN